MKKLRAHIKKFKNPETLEVYYLKYFLSLFDHEFFLESGIPVLSF